MKRFVLLMAACGLMLAQAAQAQGKDRDRHRGRGSDSGWEFAQNDGNGWGTQFSPAEARDAVKEGRTVPLSRIFQALKREYGGYQLGAELYSSGDGGAVYEIDWLTEDGRKVRVTVDAQTGSVLDRQGG